MTDKQYKGNSLFDMALAAEGVTGPRAEFARSIYQQESGSGSNTKTSNAGARGGMQIIPGTFREVADPEWSIDDPEQNSRAGIRYALKMLDMAGGDFALGAAGYYGGPGGIQKARKGIAVADPRNPNAPTTLEYGQQVARRMGQAAAVAAPGGPAPGSLTAAIDAQLAQGLSEFGGPQARQDIPALQAAGFDATIRAETEPTGFEVFGAAVSGASSSRLFNGLSDVVGHVFQERSIDVIDPEFRIPEADMLAARSEDDLQDLREIRNAEDYARYKQEKIDDELRLETLFSAGVPTGIALSLAAELTDPVNLLTAGAASIRAVASAAQAAKTGAQFNVINSAIAENFISGTAVEAAIQLSERKFDGASLGISVAADLLMGGGAGYMALRQTQGLAELQRAAESKIIADAKTIEKAKDNLGANHTTEQLDAEFDKVRLEEVRSPIVQSITPSKPSEKLMPHPEDDVEPTAPAVAEVDADMSPSTKPLDIVTAHEPTLSRAAIASQPAGVNLAPSVQNNLVFTKLAESVKGLFDEFLPGRSITLSQAIPMQLPNGKFAVPNGVHIPAGDNASFIGIAPGPRATETLVHEIGHMIELTYLESAPEAVQKGVYDAFSDWLAVYKAVGKSDEALLRRGPLYRTEIEDTDKVKSLRDVRAGEQGNDYADKYYGSFKEFMAEQFNKYVEAGAVGQGKGVTLPLSRQIIDNALAAMKRMLALFTRARDQGLIAADSRVEDFFEGIRQANLRDLGVQSGEINFDAAAKVTQGVNDFLTNPDAIRFNLTGLPLSTAGERADAKAMLALRLKAEAWGQANPRDEAWMARAKNLADNDVMNVASTGLTMLKSEDDLSRMLGHMLLEDASGVAGKRPMNSAAISKDAFQKLFLGNTINDMQNAFSLWSKARGGSFKDDYINGGSLREAFNREIAAEIEHRSYYGKAKNTDPHVNNAILSSHAAFERMRNAQIEHKTLGWAALPKEEVWYMPHSMSPAKVNMLTPAQTDVLRSALTDQYVSIEGWDISFADKLAAAVVAKAKARATGGFDTPLGGTNPGSAQIIEDALESMNMSADEIRATMKQYNKGAANFTKSRITLDLNKEYDVDGAKFKLLDVYETDQLTLLRSQAGRVSGDVALAQQGIYGKPGMALLRKTMAHNVQTPEQMNTLRAFDQIAAEFINEPFGTQASKVVERLTTMTSLLRLGGILYSQFSEFIQGVFHVGAARTLSSIAAVPRLRREIIDLAAGKKVDNPLLTSLETFGGEFGTDSYKIILPFDAPDHAYPTYGRDTLTMFDRLLRGGSHMQSKLSGWRALHAAQQRGIAEQIVSKMTKYIRDGKNSVSLEQMGISPELAAKIKAELPNAAKFDSNGNLESWDIAKFADQEVATATWQAVKRGTAQIIQGPYIGETGAWAHDGYLKMLTQFRTFSITSMEKQWGRQRNSRGGWQAFGMVMGAMSLAVPIHAARTYANSIGREDQAEYIEKNMQLERVVRASLNYVASAGMLPDLIDMAAAAAPEALVEEYTGLSLSGVTGGRGGQTSSIHSLIPAVGTANDIWSLVQNMNEVNSWERMAPLNRHPLLVPITNALGD